MNRSQLALIKKVYMLLPTSNKNEYDANRLDLSLKQIWLENSCQILLTFWERLLVLTWAIAILALQAIATDRFFSLILGLIGKSYMLL